MLLTKLLLTLVPLTAALPDGRKHANLPPLPVPPPVELPDVHARVFHVRTAEALPPLNTTYYFDQLIDHENPSLGTFKQRYWTTWNFYEPGRILATYLWSEG